MSGAIVDYTLNYNLEIPNFDFPNWHTYYARNFKTMDGLLYLLTGITSVRGAWLNSTLYAVGDRVLDPNSSNAYACLVTHTSSATGLLSADIAAHPTYWRLSDLAPVGRGAWTTATVYYKNDFVSDGTIGGFYACLVQHTSGVFATDLAAGKWVLLLNFQTAIDYATKIDGAISGTSDYSAKAWAIGGTGTTTNNAQYWAGVAQAAVASLTGALIFKGTWSPSTSGAVLPGAGVAQIGWVYRVIGATTTTFGDTFNAGDSIVAIVNNASTSVFTANWIKLESTLTSTEITTALGFTPLNPANNLSELTATTALTNLGLSADGKSLVTAANYTTMLTNLGLSANGKSLVTAANYATMVTLLGAVPTTVSAPTHQVFLSGTSATYTTPASVKYIRVRLVGGGGGGGGTAGAGTAGGNTTFSTLTGGGGGGGGSGSGTGGSGGSASGGDVNIVGGSSGGGTTGNPNLMGIKGAASAFGGGGSEGYGYSGGVGGGGAASTNSGAGGGGAGSSAGGVLPGGGGSGGYVEKTISVPAATYTYTVGGGGSGGSGTGGAAGGTGGSGIIIVDEFYS